MSGIDNAVTLSDHQSAVKYAPNEVLGCPLTVRQEDLCSQFTSSRIFELLLLQNDGVWGCEWC